jgi:single-stranded DNA-binding protein
LNDNDIKANQTSNERHNFTILTSAPQQPLLNHEYDDTISFSVTSWKYDAERILQTAHKGRQLIVEGYLRSYNGYVSVTVRNGLVEMFGKKKDKENKIVNKSDSASKVVIQGESKEELPI